MTAAQERALVQLLGGPVLDGGRSHGAYASLVRAGLATYLPAPGFEITDAGRAALVAASEDSAEVAAVWAKAADDARSRGRAFLASRYDRAARRALDRANDLRQGSGEAPR